MAITQIAFIGDSTTQGTVDNASISQGGPGCWVEQITDRLASNPTIGPVLGSGVRSVHLEANADSEWLRTGAGWTQTTSSNAYDKWITGRAFYSTTSTDLQTWTLPTQWRTPVGFAIYWIDFPSAGNWQYSVNGGSTWANMGQPIGHDNGLKKFYISQSISSTVQFRPSDGSSSVGMLITGIELYWQDPRTATQGLIVHNLGSGAQRLGRDFICTAGTAGDRMAFFDAVTLGTNAISNQPSLVVSMWLNDIVENNTTNWASYLTTVHNRMSTFAKMAFVNVYEASGTVDYTVEQSYRNQLKTTANALVDKYFDIYDAWASNGWGGALGDQFTKATAAGLLYDTLHEAPIGHTDISNRLYWWLITSVLTGISSSHQSYPIAAKSLATSYKSSYPTAATSASLPVNLLGQ